MSAGQVRYRLWIGGLATAAVLLAACQPIEPVAPPALLHVSAIPDQAPALVRQQHEGVVLQVCASAGMRCQWVDSPTYEAVVDGLGRGRIDLAFLGGVTFVQARHRFDAAPLAMRDIDFRFTSLVVVREANPARRLADLKGSRFLFGNRSSTSGHIMARHLLGQAGIDPESHFAAVGYTANHDETLARVARGEVDAGTVNGSVYYRRLAAADPAARALRVLWQSPPYADYVWAARRGLPASLRQRLTDAFLDLDASRPEQRTALEREGTVGFVPVRAADFDDVLQVVRDRGLL